MSSRVRIMFYSGEVPGAFIGKAALAEMERLYKAYRTPAEVYKLATAADYNRPQDLVMRVNAKTGLGEYWTVQKNQIIDCPEALRGVPRARWLWEHLSPIIKKNAVLHAAREGRSRMWRKQAANPRMYGLSKSKKKKVVVAPSIYGALADAERAAQRNRVASPSRVVSTRVTADHEEPPATKLRIGIWA